MWYYEKLVHENCGNEIISMIIFDIDYSSLFDKKYLTLLYQVYLQKIFEMFAQLWREYSERIKLAAVLVGK